MADTPDLQLPAPAAAHWHSSPKQSHGALVVDALPHAPRVSEVSEYDAFVPGVRVQSSGFGVRSLGVGRGALGMCSFLIRRSVFCFLFIDGATRIVIGV